MHESLVRDDKQRVDLGQGSHETRVQGISTSLYELDRGKLSGRHNDGRTLRYGNDRCKQYDQSDYVSDQSARRRGAKS